MNKEKFFSWLDKVMDIIMLSLLILTFSLPIVTILASFSAGIHVFRQKRTGASDNVFQLFFSNFKASFFKGFISQLAICFFYFIGLVNIEIAQTTTRSISIMVYTMTIFFLMVITLIAINYMFVITDKEQPVKLMLRQSLIISFVKFPYALLIGICYLIFVISSIFFPPMMILTIGTVCYIHERFAEKIWDSFGHAYNSNWMAQ